jgi:hypothetical protein
MPMLSLLNCKFTNHTTMTRQSLYELIENASQQQKQDLAWVGNLFKKRIKELMETNVKYKAWLKTQKDSPDEN